MAAHVHCRRLLTVFIRRLWTRQINVKACVLSSGGLGTSKSVLIDVPVVQKDDADHRKKRVHSYLFNCGEGTKRIYNMYRYRNANIEDVFITHTSWRNLGGLKGVFTEGQIYQGGTGNVMFRKELNLYGPELMVDRFYVGENPIKNLVNATTDMFHEDETVQMKFIPIFPVLSEEDLKSYPAALSDEVRSWKIEGAKPRLTRKLSSIIYVVKVKNQEKDIPTIIILECPDENYLESLLESEDLRRHQRETGTVVFHLSPVHVVNDPKYEDFVNRFDKSTQHLHLDETQGAKSQQMIRMFQEVLNSLDTTIFPLLESTEVKKSKKSQKMTTVNSGYVTILGAKNIIEMNNRWAQCNRYKKKMEEVVLNDDEYLKSIQKFVNKQDRVEDYPELLFLGTGATIPRRMRNVTGIYLHTSPDTAILLDCGEGTYTQMCLFFGNTTKEMLRKIKCIFISHLHADHIVGLANVLRERHSAFEDVGLDVQPVDIISEDDTPSLIRTIEFFVPNILENTNLHKSRYFRPKGYLSEVHTKLNMKEMRTVKAIHNHGKAHSLSLVHADGWHVVYSGDTMPSTDLVTAGLNCDILIHEATFCGKQLDVSRCVSHCTVPAAVKVGQDMNAKKTILTHFHPRSLQKEEKQLILSNTNITIAMDHMRVRMRDLAFTPLYNPFFIEFSNISERL